MKPTDAEFTRGRPPKYPWDLILDGTKWLLEFGVDFDCDPNAFRERAYQVAKARGIRVSCSLAGNDIIIRALIEELIVVKPKVEQPKTERNQKDVSSEQKEG